MVTRYLVRCHEVRYDFDDGVLVYDDGITENYLHFLIDYLNAVRLCHYLLEVVFTFARVMAPHVGRVASSDGA